MSNELHLIEHYEGSNKRATFIDTPNQLAKTIRTTWSQIPHDTVHAGLVVEVYRKGTQQRLAHFIVTPVTSWPKLPDHL